jgi:hypothetical protein
MLIGLIIQLGFLGFFLWLQAHPEISEHWHP